MSERCAFKMRPDAPPIWNDDQETASLGKNTPYFTHHRTDVVAELKPVDEKDPFH